MGDRKGVISGGGQQIWGEEPKEKRHVGVSMGNFSTEFQL